MRAHARAAMLISEWHMLLPSPTYASFRPRRLPKRSSSVKKSAKRLARMIQVGKRVDHRYVRVRCELIERFLLKDARHDPMHPAFEALRDVWNRLALAEVRDGVIEKHARAAQACDADFKRDARAQRRLFENQRQKTAGQSATVAVGMRLHVGGQLTGTRALARGSTPCR